MQKCASPFIFVPSDSWDCKYVQIIYLILSYLNFFLVLEDAFFKKLCFWLYHEYFISNAGFKFVLNNWVSYLNLVSTIGLLVEFLAPCGVLDIQDALVKSAQPLEAGVEFAFYLQEDAAELWTLAVPEDWQGSLLTILPASKLMLAVTYLREDKRKIHTLSTHKKDVWWNYNIVWGCHGWYSGNKNLHISANISILELFNSVVSISVVAPKLHMSQTLVKYTQHKFSLRCL